MADQNIALVTPLILTVLFAVPGLERDMIVSVDFADPADMQHGRVSLDGDASQPISRIIRKCIFASITIERT